MHGEDKLSNMLHNHHMELKIEFENDEKGGKWTAKDPQNPELIAYMSYVQAGPEKIIIDHTVVPEGFSQRGTGKALLRAGIEYMRANKLVTLPTCSFALSQLKKYPEFHDVLDSSQI